MLLDAVIRCCSLFALILLLYTPFMATATAVINFDKVQASNNATILDLYRSQNGALWIAYRDSIVRKRGDTIDSYRLDITKFDLSFPVSINIIEYKSAIWVSYENSWHVFDAAENDFNKVVFAEIDDSGVADMYVDSDGIFWIATFSAIYKKTPQNPHFSQVSFPQGFAPMYEGEPLQLFAHHFVQDKTGQLWLGSEYLGLIKIPQKPNQTFVRYDIASDTSVLSKTNSIITIEPLNDEILLLGTTKGLFVFNTTKQSYHQLLSESKLSHISHINPLQSKQVLLNANGHLLRLPVLHIADPAYTHQVLAENSFNGAINLLKQDVEGVIWLGVESGGLFKGSAYSSAVRALPTKAGNKTTPESFITVINNAIVYGGGRGSNLLAFEPFEKSPAFSFFADGEQHYIGSQNHIIALPSGHQYNIEFSQGGADKITSLAGSGNILVMVSSEFGLIIYDRINDSYHHITNAKHLKLDERDVLKVFTSSIQNKVVLVFPQGIYLFDITTFKLARKPRLNPSFEIFRAAEFDQQIVVFDQHKNVRIFNKRAEFVSQMQLPLTNIGCMASLQPNVWWLASAHGPLYRWRSDSGELNQLTSHDGLSKNGVNGNGCLRFNSQLLFTGQQAINLVDKNSKTFNHHQPNVAFDLTYQQEDVKQFISAINPHQMAIAADGFPLVIKLFSDSQVAPEQNRLRLRIPQMSAQWDIRSQSNNSFVFNHLPTGALTIEMAASNNDGVWSASKSINIYVQPPWYYSWLAIICYVVIILLMFLWFSRYRLSNAIQRADNLEKVVSQRTEELAQQKQHVETLLSSKEQEFVHLSHELRTPLTLVLSPLKALVDAEQHLTKRKTMEVIQRNSQRLLRMVDQLLHLEKFKMQQVEQRVVQDIALSLRLLVESFHLVAKDKNITLNLAKIPAINGCFIADSFEKIFLNLISNAIKYTPRGGVVNIRGQLLDDGGLSIVVADNGCGIIPKQLPLIFAKYYRVIDVDSEKVSGAGVGLSLVKQLLDYHDALIEVKSQFGQGSSFEVTFPAALLTHDKPSNHTVNVEQVNIEIDVLSTNELMEVSLPDVSQNDEKQVLLVVEDNQDMRHYIKQILGDYYTVHLAVDGKQGLDKAISLIPDLVISDVMMPQMNGFELCEALKKNVLVCHVPVILLSARGDRESRIKGWQKATDEYLTKPFDEEELIIRVSNLLSIRKLLRIRFGREIEDGKSLNVQDNQASFNTFDLEFIEKVEIMTSKNYQQVSFSSIEFAALLAMSERQLQRKMKSLINISPKEYIRVYRLNQAKKLLKQGMQVNRVADECGFSSHSYFASCFKAKFAMTAKQYQQASD